MTLISLDAIKMRQLMSQALQDQVQELTIYQKIDSTNRVLLEQSITDHQLHICLAEQQTQGRGRRGRQWFSPYGANLYLSILKIFNLTMSEVSGLSILTALAVVKVLNQQGIKAGLKWPNDIYYQNKKLGGILLEVTGQPSGPVKVVMGIGLNIKMPEQAETQIDQAWIDLKNQNIDRNYLTVAILETLSLMILDYQKNQLKTLYLEWQKYDIWEGQGVYLIQGQTKIAGICRGIDNLGALCLEINGQIKTFQAGEVSLRKQE